VLLPELEPEEEALAPGLREPVEELLMELLRERVLEGEEEPVPLPEEVGLTEAVGLEEEEAVMLPVPLLLPELEALAP
jgi:hypothetical protein